MSRGSLDEWFAATGRTRGYGNMYGPDLFLQQEHHRHAVRIRSAVWSQLRIQADEGMLPERLRGRLSIVRNEQHPAERDARGSEGQSSWALRSYRDAVERSEFELQDRMEVELAGMFPVRKRTRNQLPDRDTVRQQQLLQVVRGLHVRSGMSYGRTPVPQSLSWRKAVPLCSGIDGQDDR